MGNTIKKTGVGIIGCGNISGIYLKNLTQVFDKVELVAVADLDMARAEAKAAEFPPVKAMTVEQLLADPDISVVVNLTIPLAHASVGKAILQAGKSLYLEKPLSVCLADGEELVRLAAQKNLRIGAAPDTFLGAGIQTCRKLIDDGWIGTPVGGSAFMLCGGHEGWHPDPEFYYKAGAGPMFDMGPYYLTALTALLGPVKSLMGSAKKSFDQRTIGSQPKKGQTIEVDVPTHVSGILEFEGGASVTLTTSFDTIGGTSHVPIEIYGSEGTIQVPDPNTFGGPVRYRRKGSQEWTEIPLLFGYAENSRGLGVADLAKGLVEGTSHRADGALALHVLEVMHGIHRSAETGQRYLVKNSCRRPQALDSK